MATREISRRALLQGSAALAGLAFLRLPLPADAFPDRPGEEVLPWLDQPAPNPVPEVAGTLLHWEELDSWITPNEKFFTITHFGPPSCGLPAVAP